MLMLVMYHNKQVYIICYIMPNTILCPMIAAVTSQAKALLQQGYLIQPGHIHQNQQVVKVLHHV